MGLFGKKDDGADVDGPSGGPGATLAATAQRLGAMSLDELADELFRGTFGPGAPGDGQVMPLPSVLVPYDPTGSGYFAGLPHDQWRDVAWLVEEGLQHLEHQGLVVTGVSSGSRIETTFRLTRAGRARVA